MRVRVGVRVRGRVSVGVLGSIRYLRRLRKECPDPKTLSFHQSRSNNINLKTLDVQALPKLKTSTDAVTNKQQVKAGKERQDTHTQEKNSQNL